VRAKEAGQWSCEAGYYINALSLTVYESAIFANAEEALTEANRLLTLIEENKQCK
jgi:hypothetical protein